MFRRFVNDESGIALGLAIIMIVLIGVMGTGLLVFVQNDLQAVIELRKLRAQGPNGTAEELYFCPIDNQDMDETSDSVRRVVSL